MSRSSRRFLLGSARRRARESLRRLRGRARRRPPAPRVVPRPARPAGRGRLHLTRALLACDLNAPYLRLWPLARSAWSEIVGLEPLLVLVAHREDVPLELLADRTVVVFDPLPGLHTAFQAQCVRLLYPGLLDGDGGVVVADVDMAPLSRRFFVQPALQVDAAHFVAYRDTLVELGEIPICYNAARPATWGAIFGVRTLDDVHARLADWGSKVTYTGEHGGEGWTTDQRILYRTLLERGRAARDVWILDDYYTGFRRLERTYVEKWGVVSDAARRGLERGEFTDFHLVRTESEHAHLNEAVLDLAAANATGSHR